MSDYRYLKKVCPGHPNPDCEGKVPVHRLVAEKFLGRFLNPEEVVHHIDENTKNNVITNLIVFEDNASHTAWHKKMGSTIEDGKPRDYGIVLYGPNSKNKIKKQSLTMAERMKRELGLNKCV